MVQVNFSCFKDLIWFKEFYSLLERLGFQKYLINYDPSKYKYWGGLILNQQVIFLLRTLDQEIYGKWVIKGDLK
jgi:hypothetical protein